MEENFLFLSTFIGFFKKNTVILYVVPPKFCISIVLNFSWRNCESQEKLKTMLMQNFGGATKSIMVFLKKAYYKLNIKETAKCLTVRSWELNTQHVGLLSVAVSIT